MLTDLNERLSTLLLHPRLREGSAEERLIGQIVVWLVSGGLVGALLTTIWFLAVDDLRLIWSQLAYLLGVLLAPIFTRVVGTVGAIRLYMLSVAWVVITAVTASTGGATSSAMYFYALIPFFGAALAGVRGATLGAIAVYVSALGFYLLHAAGVALPADGVYALEVDPTSIAAATLLVYALSFGFIRSRRSNRVEVASSARRVAQANARAAAARAELERAHAAKVVALTRVGEGLHPPLVRISEAARRLREGLPDALQDHADMVGRSAQQLLLKLDSFALYTSSWAGEPGAVASFDVAAAVEGLVSARTSDARARGVALSVATRGSGHRRRGDRARLERILVELLDNATKFTSAGSIDVQVDGRGREAVVVTVRDTGAGIPVGERDRVFEPLYRGDVSTTRRAGGTGLGLAVARRLAEGLGGSLVCDHEVVDGTRMVLSLPFPLANGDPS